MGLGSGRRKWLRIGEVSRLPSLGQAPASIHPLANPPKTAVTGRKLSVSSFFEEIHASSGAERGIRRAFVDDPSIKALREPVAHPRVPYWQAVAARKRSKRLVLVLSLFAR